VNALLAPDPSLRAMTTSDLDAVLAIESQAYAFPWSRGNFIDSLAAGYLAQVLASGAAGIVGYFVAMTGAGEMHLLNLTVAPAWQGRGLAGTMLDALQDHCATQRLGTLWLEVRASNLRAQALYRRRGFADVGMRRGYYPAARAAREDAVVMRLQLAGEGDDGLE
jgi:[ribosomal protein S18]-alanine N-acetyltransferase